MKGSRMNFSPPFRETRTVFPFRFFFFHFHHCKYFHCLFPLCVLWTRAIVCGGFVSLSICDNCFNDSWANFDNNDRWFQRISHSFAFPCCCEGRTRCDTLVSANLTVCCSWLFNLSLLPKLAKLREVVLESDVARPVHRFFFLLIYFNRKLAQWKISYST